jgi:hypothetical protein
MVVVLLLVMAAMVVLVLVVVAAVVVVVLVKHLRPAMHTSTTNCSNSSVLEEGRTDGGTEGRKEGGR